MHPAEGGGKLAEVLLPFPLTMPLRETTVRLIQNSQLLHHAGKHGNLRLSVMQRSDAHSAPFWRAKPPFQPSML